VLAQAGFEGRRDAAGGEGTGRPGRHRLGKGRHRLGKGRHRLDKGRDRQANSTLRRIVIVRMRVDPQTKNYVARRTAEGLGKKEITHCLKRYVACEVYRELAASTGMEDPARHRNRPCTPTTFHHLEELRGG
jgi:hypothetical protein